MIPPMELRLKQSFYQSFFKQREYFVMIRIVVICLGKWFIKVLLEVTVFDLVKIGIPNNIVSSN